MEITLDTKIMDLIEEYPWLLDFLPTISPKLDRIKIRSQRDKMAKTATVDIASIAAGVTAERFIELIEDEIKKRADPDWRPEPARETVQVEKVDLDVGALTPTQVNLMLKHLPFDLTFVGPDDRVLYYSGGKERIFPRTPGIIGREVSRCHPSKSVQVVNNIVKAFKDGSKDTAEFWIQMGDKFIHIRYFSVREDDMSYAGTLEVSQEISGIKELDGERRLLDWS